MSTPGSNSVSESAVSKDRLAGMESQTLLPRLEPETRRFLRQLASEYRFTFQELRKVAQTARDLEMWKETPLPMVWRRAEKTARGEGRQRKKAMLHGLEEHMQKLASSDKEYPISGLASPPPRRVHLAERETSKKVLGLCAAYSDRTVCCGLHTIDAVRGCPFGCSYCTIQTFYGETAELESDLPAKLQALELDPERLYHVGTGQSSDSLVWGNRGGILSALLEFAECHPNVLLELKTKSDNVRDLLAQDIPPNVVCSWSLSTPTLIRNEEHRTASLERRLQAARAVADKGLRVAFHFHPMIRYRGWAQDYSEVAAELVDRFSPHEVAFLSMGSVTMIRPVAKEIRRRGGETKILQMEMVPDPHGKLTYPDEVKIDLFDHLYGALRPWHDEVFFYLCMETAKIWDAVFGTVYPTNEAFEQDFLRCSPPIP